MNIEYISLFHFGSVSSCHIPLSPGLNLIDCRHCDEVAAALGFLLCHEPSPRIPEPWLREDTRISAAIRLESAAYTLLAVPRQGRLQLSALAPEGSDATEQYRYTMSHCSEQDAMETFDGQDRTIPRRLCRYLCREEDDNLSLRTRRSADTNVFYSYLSRYIREFQPEPINCHKKYRIAPDHRGQFRVLVPGNNGEVLLSETEVRLFRYICFLNIAEFWAGFEKLRDMHHEKKPLLIRNFAEHLDQDANIQNLLARTKKLHRQSLILTTPMDAESKKIWLR